MLLVQRVVVVGFAADDAMGRVEGEHEVQEPPDKLAFMRCRASCGQRHWQASGIDQDHDSHAFPGLGDAYTVAPAPVLGAVVQDSEDAAQGLAIVHRRPSALGIHRRIRHPLGQPLHLLVGQSHRHAMLFAPDPHRLRGL